MNMFTELVQKGSAVGTMRDERRQETVAKVLDGAGELFRRQGFAEATIRDIAAVSGVSIGTVISVGGKDALLLATFDRLIKDIHDSRAPAAADGSRVDRIAALFDPFIDLFTGDPVLARAYASVLVAGEHDSVVFTELSGILVAEIEAVLRDAEPADREETSARAESIYFAYIGRLFTWPSGDDGDVAELRRSLRRAVAAICPREEPRA